MGVLADLRTLSHPFYITNILLALTFVLAKLTPACEYLFTNTKESCEEGFSMWESEVYFFLLVIIMFRSRKQDTRNMISYLSLASTYTKACNFILWFSVDPVSGIVYSVFVLIQFLLLGEPVYKGPENVVYYQAAGLDEELDREKQNTYIICFFTSWSPPCASLAPAFAKLSLEYTLDNLRFGKVDIGKYPEVAKNHHINTTAFSLQIPTISVFKEGKEIFRKPCLDEKGKFRKFYFTEDNIRAAFDLNNLYLECQKKNKGTGKSVLESHVKSE